MIHKQFFAAFEKLYWAKGYKVKFWCQCSTFSFSIFHDDESFLGTPSFESKVYDFWNDPKTMAEIVRDAKAERKKLLNKNTIIEL